MKSGFSIRWTQQAVYDLENIIGYLLHHWSEKEVRDFVETLDQRIALISSNPRLFPKTQIRPNVRRSVLSKHTVIYYETLFRTVRILTLFDPRRAPSKLKIPI